MATTIIDMDSRIVEYGDVEDDNDRKRLPFPSGYVEPGLQPVVPDRKVPGGSSNKNGWHPGLPGVNKYFPN